MNLAAPIGWERVASRIKSLAPALNLHCAPLKIFRKREKLGPNRSGTTFCDRPKTGGLLT
jgi:hypothetical protein